MPDIHQNDSIRIHTIENKISGDAEVNVPFPKANRLAFCRASGVRLMGKQPDASADRLDGAPGGVRVFGREEAVKPLHIA
jgi:hypothetical protein